MKLYGTLTEQVSIQYREDTFLITVRPNQSTTYTVARDIQLPPGDTDHVLVSASSTSTLTGKTLTAPDITGGSYINLLTQGAIRFNDDSGGQYIALQAPTGVTTHTLKLPAAQGGANTVIQNDGSGNLSWGAVAATVTTTRGDLIRRGAAADERFAAVTDNRIVRGDGTDVISGQIDDPDFFTTGAAAGAAAIGIVTTAAQTLAGEKTFSTGIKLPTTGGTAASLTYYEEFTYSIQNADLATQTGGGTFSSTSGTVRATRIGKAVILTLDSFATTTASSVNGILIQGSGALPARFRPTADQQLGTYNLGVGGTDVAWRLEVTSGGVISMTTRDNASGANTTITNAAYTLPFSGSYTL